MGDRGEQSPLSHFYVLENKVKKITSVVVAMLLVAGAVSGVWASKPQTGDAAQIIVKPNAGQALQILKAGNEIGRAHV